MTNFLTLGKTEGFSYMKQDKVWTRNTESVMVACVKDVPDVF